MRKLLIGSLLLLSFIFTCFAAIYVYLNMAGPLSQDKIIILPKGESLKVFADKLHQENIITNPKIMLFAMHLINRYNSIKAGEYLLYHRATPMQIIGTLIEGRSVIHKFTVIEGATVRQIIDKVNAEALLTGEIEGHIKEGDLLPETYYFTYGDSRNSLIERMKKNMEHVLEQLWLGRQSNIPIKTKEEALVLASIIEKETSLASERKKVAAVFINRINKNMRLQADPTTIYGITMGQYDLSRELTKKDLINPSPYNTYHIFGLPPAPIANPGKDAIEAALNPDKTDALYFVVDGRGGHNFSNNLKEHNNNVAAFRKSK